MSIGQININDINQSSNRRRGRQRDTEASHEPPTPVHTTRPPTVSSQIPYHEVQGSSVQFGISHTATTSPYQFSYRPQQQDDSRKRNARSRFQNAQGERIRASLRAPMQPIPPIPLPRNSNAQSNASTNTRGISLPNSPTLEVLRELRGLELLADIERLEKLMNEAEKATQNPTHIVPENTEPNSAGKAIQKPSNDVTSHRSKQTYVMGNAAVHSGSETLTVQDKNQKAKMTEKADSSCKESIVDGLEDVHITSESDDNFHDIEVLEGPMAHESEHNGADRKWYKGFRR